MRAPEHPKQAARLAALQSFSILDTEPESEFDEVGHLVSQICDVPICIISLLDADRQWFKAECGMGARSTPIDTAICAHTILENGPLEIEDTLDDPRTADNPLCTAENGLRFYAGIPLETSEGLPIGTLCILDRKPRSLTALQRQTLAVMARQVMNQLELRRLLRREAATRRDLRAIADHAPVMLVQFDTDFRFQFVNKAYADFRGIQPGDLTGQALSRYLPDDVYEASVPVLERALSGEDVRYDFQMPDQKGEPHTLDIRYAPQLDEEGAVVGLVAAMTDVTRDRENAAYRELLHRELGHRMKNSLAVIQAIAGQTARQSSNIDDFLQSFRGRLAAMNSAQEILFLDDYTGAKLSELISSQVAPYAATRGSDTLRLSGPDVVVNADIAHSLGLALHELATNATKYGALSVDGGHVDLIWSITGAPQESKIVLHWSETGGPPAKEPQTAGFGSTLVRMSIETSLSGNVETEYTATGLRATFTIPMI